MNQKDEVSIETLQQFADAAFSIARVFPHPGGVDN